MAGGISQEVGASLLVPSLIKSLDSPPSTAGFCLIKVQPLPLYQAPLYLSDLPLFIAATPVFNNTPFNMLPLPNFREQVGNVCYFQSQRTERERKRRHILP